MVGNDARRLRNLISSRDSIARANAGAISRVRGYAYLLKDRLAYADPGGLVLRDSIDESAMAVKAVISTLVRDRVGDEVVPEGCRVQNYRFNPVVFFGHQQIPFPVGIAEDPAGNLTVEIEPGNRVCATCYFHQHTLEASQVFVLVTRRIIRATSIGFNPLAEPERLEPIDGNLYTGLRFTVWDLLEFSFVGVPANPGATTGNVRQYREAVRRELSRNLLDGKPIAPLIRKSLEPLAEPARAWSPGARFGKDKPMSKKWGKTKPKTKPAAEAPKKDGLSESGGASGGYAVDQKDDECVSEKIRVLMDEGKPQDQAVAIAISMCEGKEATPYKAFPGPATEEKQEFYLCDDASVLRKVVQVNGSKILSVKAVPYDEDDEDEDGNKPEAVTKPAPYDPEIMDEEADGPNPMGPGDDYATDVPHGAACAQYWLSELADRIPQMEPEVVDFWTGIQNEIQEWAADRYPDQGFGGDSSDSDDASSTDGSQSEQDQADKEKDEEETEEAMDRYRNPRTTSARTIINKRLNKRSGAVIAEARDYLSDISNLEPAPQVEGKRTFCRMCKAAAKTYARELDAILTGPGDDDSQPPATGNTDKADEGIDTKAILEALQPVNVRQERLAQSWFEITGQKL